MNQTNSGLLRFRSAPSTLFSNLPNAGGDKSGDLIEGFRDSSHEVLGLTSNELISNRVGEFGSENKIFITKNHSLNSQLPPHYPRQSNLDCNFQAQPKMGSTLTRQSSSPAGLFSQNGYATIRGVGNYGSGGDLNVSSNILKRQVSFSPGIVPSTLGMLTRIAEIDGENVEDSCPDDEKIGNGSGPTQFYSSEIPSFGSWNNSSHFGESFSGLKRELEDDGKLYAASQNLEMPILSHHLSLPQTSAEMEKLLQFQDSVPCKIRAKRGCATHPRSIAERVRRTRISERMRKLQELVPYMDKQTNTADMLDLAVDYIKDLQKQFKSLSDNRANCRCSNMHKTM